MSETEPGFANPKHEYVTIRKDELAELRSLSSAYREVLEGLLKLTEPTSSYEQFCEGVKRMQTVLDRKPVEPVGREEIRNILYKRLTMEGDSMDEVADNLLKAFRVERR